MSAVSFVLAMALLLLAAALPFAASAADPPKFCNKLDCPRFTVLDTKPEYELRRYEPSEWSSTVVSSMDFKAAEEEGFHRLFDYISGQNQNKTKVEMAAPVLLDIQPGQGPACETQFTTNFFMPFASQENPPLPNPDSQVSIVNLPGAVYGVRSFGGFVEQYNGTVTDNIEALASAMQRDGLQIDNSVQHLAQYDSPFRIFDRHNEVWIMVQGGA